MKELLLQRTRGKSGLLVTHLAQEHLQREVLAALYGGSAPGQSLQFLGGTCLRLIYGTHRFSEDLDFSLAPGTQIDVAALTEAIVRRLTLGGFEVEMTWKEKEGVCAGALRIRQLLAELGVSPMKDAKLLVKLEVDTRPPAGAVSETTIISQPLVMAVVHHDQPSLMAGKVHAILARRYDKGRDWYDLLWYLGRRIEPNLEQLQAALDQVPSAHCSNAADWVEGVRRKTETVAWPQVRIDVERFLERPAEASLLAAENIQNALPESHESEDLTL